MPRKGYKQTEEHKIKIKSSPLRGIRISQSRLGKANIPKGYEFKPPKLNEVAELYRQGLAKFEIATKLNCGTGLVHIRLVNSGIKLRSRSEEYSLSYSRRHPLSTDFEAGYIGGLYIWGFNGVEIGNITKTLWGKTLDIYTILKRRGIERDSASIAARKWHIENPEKWMALRKKHRQTLGLHLPTSPEIQVMAILDTVCPNEFMYTGDETIRIGNRYPDFLNINSKKKIIEVFGDYWHRGENPQDIINEYKQFGFDCLVIWESELKAKELVKERIKEFVA